MKLRFTIWHTVEICWLAHTIWTANGKTTDLLWLITLKPFSWILLFHSNWSLLKECIGALQSKVFHLSDLVMTIFIDIELNAHQVMKGEHCYILLHWRPHYFSSKNMVLLLVLMHIMQMMKKSFYSLIKTAFCICTWGRSGKVLTFLPMPNCGRLN